MENCDDSGYHGDCKPLKYRGVEKEMSGCKEDRLIDKYHDAFLADGYEGSILRLDLGPYENKRSKQLLKKKDFIDEEFKIVGAE